MREYRCINEYERQAREESIVKRQTKVDWNQLDDIDYDVIMSHRKFYVEIYCYNERYVQYFVEHEVALYPLEVEGIRDVVEYMGVVSTDPSYNIRCEEIAMVYLYGKCVASKDYDRLVQFIKKHVNERILMFLTDSEIATCYGEIEMAEELKKMEDQEVKIREQLQLQTSAQEVVDFVLDNKDEHTMIVALDMYLDDKIPYKYDKQCVDYAGCIVPIVSKDYRKIEYLNIVLELLYDYIEDKYLYRSINNQARNRWIKDQGMENVDSLIPYFPIKLQRRTDKVYNDSQWEYILEQKDYKIREIIREGFDIILNTIDSRCMMALDDLVAYIPNNVEKAMSFWQIDGDINTSKLRVILEYIKKYAVECMVENSDYFDLLREAQSYIYVSRLLKKSSSFFFFRKLAISFYLKDKFNGMVRFLNSIDVVRRKIALQKIFEVRNNRVKFKKRKYIKMIKGRYDNTSIDNDLIVKRRIRDLNYREYRSSYITSESYNRYSFVKIRHNKKIKS